MENLVSFIAKSLVDHPEDVDVKRIENGTDVTIELRVNP